MQGSGSAAARGYWTRSWKDNTSDVFRVFLVSFFFSFFPCGYRLRGVAERLLCYGLFLRSLPPFAPPRAARYTCPAPLASAGRLGGKQQPSTRFSSCWLDSRSRRLLADTHYASLFFGRFRAAQLGQSCTNRSPTGLVESLRTKPRCRRCWNRVVMLHNVCEGQSSDVKQRPAVCFLASRLARGSRQ